MNKKITNNKTGKHEFALFYEPLSQTKPSEIIQLDDPDLVHRITHVLRLSAYDSLVLFNQHINAFCTLQKIHKKGVELSYETSQQNNVYVPEITLLIPLLKREALEESLYSAVALGATCIQLITTEKSTTWQGQKEYDRLQRIMIAAAQQSKNYAFPKLITPCPLEQALTLYQAIPYKICADLQGKRCATLLETYQSPQPLVLLFGPEGDFTQTEQATINQSGFCGVKLTPTVLRSEHALMVLLGIVRSMLTK